jgi:hypothetical protein
MSLDFVAFGNDELMKKQKLGKTARCPRCHRWHGVRHSKEVTKDSTKKPSTVLAFIVCQGQHLWQTPVSYLVGLNGKAV